MSCSAQRVQNKRYNFMLKTLLKENVPTLSVEQTDSLKKTDKEIIFVDTREKKEYDVSHIKDAIWVGYSDFTVDRLKGVDKNAKIVAYCSVGARSEKITRKLIDAGFTDVSNMYGSIFEWVNQGHEVVNPKGELTKKVHAYNKTWGVWLKKGEKVYD